MSDFLDCLLSTESLRVKAGDKLLCAGLNLRVSPGEFWCLVGRNGAGKSTLLHTLAGLIAPAEGRIFLEGTDIHSLKTDALARRRGLLAQQQFDAFSSTALETVMAGRHPYQMGLNWENGEDKALARQALASVGLSHCADKDVTKLSGGERQRVGLATLLAQDPDLLLLDEPTAHQDAAAQLAVMGLMQATITGQTGKAVIAACHDINLVSRFATHVLVLADGRHWMGTVDDVLVPSILHEAFGCRFHLVETEQGRFFVPLAA
jgi:iron complex transport system ATP-binding protein